MPPAEEGQEQARVDPMASIKLDAADPMLQEGQSVWCLPVAQIQNDQVGHILEGLVLEKIEERIYRRVGFFEDCHDVYVFKDHLQEQLQIV